MNWILNCDVILYRFSHNIKVDDLCMQKVNQGLVFLNCFHIFFFFLYYFSYEKLFFSFQRIWIFHKKLQLQINRFCFFCYNITYTDATWLQWKNENFYFQIFHKNFILRILNVIRFLVATTKCVENQTTNTPPYHYTNKK